MALVTELSSGAQDLFTEGHQAPALNLSPAAAEQVTLAIREDLTLARFLEIVTARGGKSAGAIRASLGLASNFADVERFVQFAASLRDQSRLAIGEATFDIESCRIMRDGS